MPAAKRRDDGEGSAYRLGDGRWRAEVTIGWERRPDGSKKRVRRYVYGHTEQEAKAARRSLVAKREQGELPIGDQVTVGAWLTYWLDEIAVHRIRPKTMESYRGLVEHWIIPTIGDVRLRALQPEHIERLHSAMRAGRERQIGKAARVVPAKPLAASTVHQAHRILSRALKVAQQRGKAPRNAAALVDAPSLAAPRAEQYLDAAQARALLAMVEGRHNAARWSVALALGLRQGETLGLLWDDVDLDAGAITVRRQLQQRRDDSRYELVPVKTRSGERTIPLPPQLHEAMRRHRQETRASRAMIGDEWGGSALGDLVFADRLGKPINARTDYQEWRTLLDNIGAPPIRLHAARHTAATLMLLQGIDVKVVSAILGHSSTTITRDLYQHVVPELQREATARVGAVLWR